MRSLCCSATHVSAPWYACVVTPSRGLHWMLLETFGAEKKGCSWVETNNVDQSDLRSR